MTKEQLAALNLTDDETRLIETTIISGMYGPEAIAARFGWTLRHTSQLLDHLQGIGLLADDGGYIGGPISEFFECQAEREARVEGESWGTNRPVA